MGEWYYPGHQISTQDPLHGYWEDAVKAMVILHILSVAFEGKEMKFGLMIPLDLYWMLEIYGSCLFLLLIYNVGILQQRLIFLNFYVSKDILSLNTCMF